MQAVTRFFLAAMMAVLLSACASKVRLDDTAGNPDPPPGPNPVRPEPRLTCCLNEFALEEQREWNALVAKGSIYFDYDEYLVKDEYRPLLETFANYLRTHSRRQILLMGNTDERGSSEYNLALGQKRADAVRRMLILLGVPERQLEALSFGKEKPRATGSDETSWAINRRVDFTSP